MKKIIFPSEELKNLNDLSQKINSAEVNVTVSVLSGKYYGSLSLKSLKCKSLVITGQDAVCFSGAQKLICNFKRYNEHIISTDLSSGLSFDRLKYEGRQMIMARYPNFKEGELLGSVTDIDNINKRAKIWSNPSTGYLHSLHEAEWGGNCYKINGYKNGALNLAWIGNNNRGKNYMKTATVCENIFEELDSTDEWFYDVESGKLYIFCDGDFNESAEIEIFTSQNILSIENCRETDIKIENITFCDTDRSMFKSPWERYLRSDWAFNKNSVLEIKNSENIKIQSCTFTNLGANAIGIYDFAENIEVENCTFTNSLSNGVLILGNPDSTYCTSSWGGVHKMHIENKHKIGHKTENFPRNIKINNSYFYNLGTEDKQSAAVCLSLCKNVTINGCTIHHLPRAGINICENSFGGNTVSNCDIFDCVRETGDHGPFNSWGRDRYWSLFKFETSGKFGKYKKKYALYDMEEHNIIKHNRISGHKGFGIDLDDGSSNYVIEENFCYGVGIKLREGFFRTVRNNIVIGAPLDLHTTFWGNDDKIYSNIVVNEKPLNVIILNKGYTTDVHDNYFVNSDKKEQSQKLLLGKENYFISETVENIKTGNFNFPEFTAFNLNFGKDGCPKPSLKETDNAQKAMEIDNPLGVFSSLDEGLRSASGAPDLNGIYVKELFGKNILTRAGVKPNDVLILINGQDPKKILESNSLSEINQISVVRQQNLTELK